MWSSCWRSWASAAVFLTGCGLISAAGGPGNAYSQQFLVRGYYMETDAEDEEEGVEEMHEANTYWVDQEVLLDSIDADDVKKALKERFKRVLADIC